MNIAFFGCSGSFHPRGVGGVESFVRRLGDGVTCYGDTVEYVIYGTDRDHSEPINNRTTLCCFRHMRDALRRLRHHQHILEIHVRREDRLRFASFRARTKHTMRFHRICFSWPDSWVRRTLMLGDVGALPLNGWVFVVSHRQYRSIKRWCPRVVHLLPPVPDSYFVGSEQGMGDGPVALTYIGRVDILKGVQDAANVFRFFRNRPDIRTKIMGCIHSSSLESRRLHERLLRQAGLGYEPLQYETHSPEVEEAVRRELHETDILVLPYVTLSSTIDMPMLLLEGMASLCAVMTRPYGDIQRVYGSSDFLIKGQDFVQQAIGLVDDARNLLPKERKRLAVRNAQLCFRSSDVVDRFRRTLCT